jgi:pSer/pThr/pTyr-binding forkhead associated (FHA) protein
MDEDGVATVRDRVPLGHGLTLGRQAIPGQVVLDHPNVSRRHAAFEIVGGTVMLRDLGGTNVPMSTATDYAVLVVWSRVTVSISAHSN